jgi:hypothetical protein
VPHSLVATRVNKAFQVYLDYLKPNMGMRVLMHSGGKRAFVLGFPVFEGVVGKQVKPNFYIVESRLTREQYRLNLLVRPHKMCVMNDAIRTGDHVAFRIFFDVNRKSWRLINESCMKIDE